MTDAATIRTEAQALRAAGRAAEARKLLDEALANDPGSTALRLERSIIARVLGDQAGSLAISQGILADHPKYQGALTERVEALMALRDFPAARAAVDALADAFGDSAFVLHRRAQILRATGDDARAAAMLGAAIVRHPQNAALKTELAALCRALGDHAGCLALCRAALADAPDNRTALLVRLEVLTAIRALPEARAALEEAQARLPGDALVARREAQLLRAEGRLAEATQGLEALIAAQPGDTGLRFDLAELLRAQGEHDRAVLTYDAALARDPGHKWALLGRIDALLAGQRPAEARVALDAAQARLGADDPALAACAGRTLRAEGRLAEAAATVEAALARNPGSVGLRLDLAGSCRALGDHDRALALSDAVLAAEPGNRWGLIGRIESLTALGHADAALQAVATAKARLPGDPLPVLRQGALLRTQGRLAEAAACLQAIGTPDTAVQNELASVLRAMGDAAGAHALSDAVIAREPDNRGAQFGRIEALLLDGDAAAMAAEARRLIPAACDGTLLATDLLLRILTTLSGPDAAQLFTDARPALVAAAARLTCGQAWALYRKADETGLGQDMAFLCEAFFDGRTVGPHEAAEILRTLQQSGTPDWPAIAADLVGRMTPEAAGPFRLELLSQTDGAAAALAARKRLLTGPRRQAALRALTQLLLQDGRAATAARYLARFWRRQPDPLRLVSFVVSVLMQTGREAQARQVVADTADALRAAGPALRAALAQCLLHTGQMTAACAEIDAIATPAHRRPLRADHVRTLIALGRTDEAARIFADLKATPLRREDLHTAPSLAGVLVTECLTGSPAGGQDMTAPQAILRIGAFAARPPGAPPAGAIPPRIAQFWNTSDPPAEILRIMRRWQDVPGFAYRRFDARSAAAFIGHHLGPDWTRAFGMARTPTEQSDYFRLCYLLTEGGVYADADDLLHGDLAAFHARSAGLVVYRETLGGALGNNLILTPPRHPAIVWAAIAARRALTERHNDSTWFRLGPGLLTRAVARHVVRADAAGTATDVTVLSQADAARLVLFHVPLPYKRGTGYWNRPTAATALSALVARHAAQAAAPAAA